MKQFKAEAKNIKILKITSISLFVFFLVTFLSGVTACKNNSQATTSQSNEVTASGTESSGTGSAASSAANETTASAETAAATEEAVPTEIQDLINNAGNYFKDGEYSLAEKSYRNAELAIDN
ncbi:MAG: hypothetical protein M1409_01410, partial [Actinobacteria bacterium]|nr:hypothetical protein [Actinomycetota bacterium]